MFTKTATASLLALLASSVSAQTFTECNPLNTTCSPDPALGTSLSIDYTKGADSSGFFKMLSGTSLTYDNDKGAVFKISKEGEAPTLVANKYIFFGKVEVVLQAAPGVGIVTSIVLQSDDLDEIDWEWVGGDTTQVQTNYFSKGDTSTYDRGKYHSIDSPQTQFYTYTIDWTKDAIKWQVNGNTVRTLTYADAKNGATYPQTPCQLRIGTWVGGSASASKGTVEWAGGYTDFSTGPFTGYYKSITVQDYSTGATEYVYGDKTGTYDSIIVKKDGTSSSSSSSSGSASSSTTASASSSTASGSSTLSSSVTAAANSTSTGTGSNSSASSTTGSGSGSGSQTSGTPTPTAAPGAGAANLPNFILMGAAAALGYLVL